MAAMEGVRFQVTRLNRKSARYLRPSITMGLLRMPNQMREGIEGMQRQLDALVGVLRQPEEEMSAQGMDPTSLGGHVRFFSS